jgi:prepilin-type N-terminal cleavage/methylation domain-containing protein/prepilin-type processing-associated H-X9-DG protein
VSRRELRGFTLVELLVVIAILSMLAAILVPVTSRVRGFARKTECLSNLGQLGKAISLYADDNGEWYPCASGLPSREPTPGLPGIRALLEEYGSAEIFECSDDRATDPAYPFATYLDGEGSSYEWAELLNRHRIGQPLRFRRFDLEILPIMRDYEPFHRRGGGKIGVNALYADGHVEGF